MRTKKSKKKGLIIQLVIWSVILCGLIINDLMDHPEDAKAGYDDFIQSSVNK